MSYEIVIVIVKLLGLFGFVYVTIKASITQYTFVL